MWGRALACLARARDRRKRVAGKEKPRRDRLRGFFAPGRGVRGVSVEGAPGCDEHPDEAACDDKNAANDIGGDEGCDDGQKHGVSLVASAGGCRQQDCLINASGRMPFNGRLPLFV